MRPVSYTHLDVYKRQILSFSLAWLINEVNSKLRMLFVLIFYSPAIAGSIYVVFGVLFSGGTYGYVNGFLQSWGFIDRICV